MKLDRNINADGRGKYGLVLFRRLADVQKRYDSGQGDAGDLRVLQAAMLLERVGIIDPGATLETEFFPIRLKDKYAGRALRAYAVAAFSDDREYAEEIKALAERSGAAHPNCKKPD